MNEDAERREQERAYFEAELVCWMIAAMREVDSTFERVGGSTRHHVRDCLLPILAKHGLQLRFTDSGASQGQANG